MFNSFPFEMFKKNLDNPIEIGPAITSFAIAPSKGIKPKTNEIIKYISITFAAISQLPSKIL